MGEQRVAVGRTAFVPDQRAEAARVAQAQHALAEDEVDVVVLLRGAARGDQAQAARHAQVQDQPAAAMGALAIEQQVFAAA
jgi:hypothetical protein